MQIKGFLINIGSSYAHIVLSVLMNIMYIPIALHYMGIERYGVWVVLMTMINYLTLANFGIPTAVTNLMSQSDSNIEKTALLLKGFKILSLTCLGVLFASLLSYYVVANYTNWLLNLTVEIKISSIILIVFFILRIPFQIASAAFTANKKIFVGKIYDLLTIVLTFLSLLLAIYLKKNLIFLATTSGILLLMLNIVSFWNALRILNFSYYEKRDISINNKHIYKPGLALFAAGMGSLIIWNTDNIVISRFLGFEEVAIYSTAFRLFSFGYMSFNLIYGVLIPYYGQFYKQKMWFKLESLFNFNIIIIPFIAICVWLVGWLFAKDIIYLWLGDYKLYAGPNLYFLLGAYGLVLSYVGVMFNLLTSLNLLRGLFYMTIAEAGINLIASILCARAFGSEGVAFGTLIASIAVPLAFLPFLIDKNYELKFRFPFKKSLISLIFYTSCLLLLYFIKASDYKFFTKFFISIVTISFFVLFQYLFNKDLITEVYKIIKPNNDGPK